RRRRGGKAPLPLAILEPAQRLIDLELADDLRPRRDVADLLREEAGAVLLHEAGGAALENRLLVLLASLLAALDLADDPASLHGERIPAHRGIGGERELVGCLQRLRVVVVERLPQDHASPPGPGVGDR